MIRFFQQIFGDPTAPRNALDEKLLPIASIIDQFFFPCLFLIVVVIVYRSLTNNSDAPSRSRQSRMPSRGSSGGFLSGLLIGAALTSHSPVRHDTVTYCNDTNDDTPQDSNSDTEVLPTPIE